MDEHRDELGETIKNELFDLEGPRQLNRQFNAREQYFGLMFQYFTEISKSLETLEDINFYIGRFPYSGTKITRERYLQFNVESHFSEIYILRERLNRFTTFIERQFRRHPHLENVQTRCAVLRQAIVTALEGVSSVRGRHIHELRFGDDGIDRISTMGLLSRGSDDELSTLIKQYYRSEYRRIRKVWRDRTRGDFKAIQKLLDLYFDELYPIAFDADTGEIRYPHGARG